MGKHKNNPNRLLVLTAFRENPGASVREIAEATGLSLCGTHHNLVNLEAEGIIHRKRDRKHSQARRERSAAKRAELRRLTRERNSRSSLAERIELVVKMARENEKKGTGHDVITHAPLRLHRKARKVG